MIIFLAGDIHGKVSSLYERVFELEHRLGVRANYVLQTGNFGIWPDSLRVDRATRQHGNPDFDDYYYKDEPVPRTTLFVAGRHDDHVWMSFKRSRGEMEILPNLNWLLNGYKTTLGSDDLNFSITGLGKVFSPVSYKSQRPIDKKSRGHYNSTEIDLGLSHKHTDILLTHQAPKGTQLGSVRSDSDGIDKLCSTLRPKLLVHGHYNYSQIYTPCEGTTAVSLAYRELSIWNYDGTKFTNIPF